MKLDFISDRCKCVSSFVLISFSVVYAIAGALLFILGYNKVKDQRLSGGDFLPEYSLTYDSITPVVFLAVISAGVTFLFGLLAA